MFSYIVDLDLGHAMKIYNNIMPGDKFTTLDLNILCLARSFFNSGNKLFMTNNQLGEYLIASHSTVQVSINRLCAAGFLISESFYTNNTKRRNLIYQPDVVQKFISDMHEEMRNIFGKTEIRSEVRPKSGLL